MSTPNILTQIWTGAVKDFHAAEQWVETAAAKVEAALPGAAPVIADLKQDASDAIGIVTKGVSTYEPELATGLETLLDAALAKYTGPFALPLTEGTNSIIQGIMGGGNALLQAWGAKAQAALAENNAALGGGTATTAVPTTAAPAAA
jgi:hypothetical protein